MAKRQKPRIPELCPLCGKPYVQRKRVTPRFYPGQWFRDERCWHYKSSPAFQRAARVAAYKPRKPTRRGDKRGQTKPR